MSNILCRSWFSAILVVLLGCSCVANVAHANLIYIFSGIGSGTLGARAFNDAQFTITAQGDQTLVTSPQDRIFRLDGVTALLEIDGLGSANFSNALNLAVNQNIGGTNPAVIFADSQVQVGGLSIFRVGNSQLSNYDLRTTFPLIDGRADINSGSSFPTTQGLLNFQTASSGRFTAVPEPTVVWWLVVAGLVRHRRRSHRSQ